MTDTNNHESEQPNKAFEKSISSLEDELFSDAIDRIPRGCWGFDPTLWNRLENCIRQYEREKVLSVVEKLYKKGRLDSPRSFGDGDIVDVSAGYNQAIQDVLNQLKGAE